MSKRTFKVQRTYKIELPDSGSEDWVELVEDYRNEDTESYEEVKDSPSKLEDALLEWLTYQCDAGNFSDYVEEHDYNSWRE